MRFQRWISGLVLYGIAVLVQAANIDLVTYYHVDHLGSPVATTDERGELLWRVSYLPYGERNPGSRPSESVGYTGHSQDDISGLVYAGARYHDSVLGRFLAIDPVAWKPSVPSSFNRYSYGYNNPYRYTDPDGRDPLEFTAGFVVGFGNELAGGFLHDSYGRPDSFAEGGYIAGAQFGEFFDWINPKGWVKNGGKSFFKRGPPANGGSARPHGNSNHDSAIDNRIDQLKKDPDVTNIRKNQQQVNVDGEKVGTNRPDIQYDKDGCHYCVEYDHVPQNSTRHGDQIKANDPKAKVELNLL